MTRFHRTVSSRLRQCREARAYSQEELADATGLKPAAISHFERGRRMPCPRNLVRLADALGVSCDFILGRK